MSLFSGLDKHEKNPGDFWGSYSSSSVQNRSSDSSEYNPENDDVCLISPSPNSTRVQSRSERPIRTCRQRYSHLKCIEIEDEPVIGKKAPQSSTDKSPEDFHVRGNSFTIPKLNGNWFNSKKRERHFSNEEHSPEDSSQEMSNKMARNNRKPLNRSWNHTLSPTSPVRSSSRIASSRAVSSSTCEEDNDNAENSAKILETEDDRCNKTKMTSKISKDDIFCCFCNGPKSNSRCLTCDNQSKQSKQQSITVKTFYSSKPNYITYSAKRPDSRKKIPNAVTKRKSLSTDPPQNQSKLESSENNQIAIEKTGKKRKKSPTTKEPELVHISSDEDDKAEQLESNPVEPMEEDEVKEDHGSSGNAFEDEFVDETAQECRDNGEIHTTSEEECPIPKEDKETSPVPVPDTRKTKERAWHNSTEGNELTDSYQRDSLEALLHVQHIYVGRLQGEPTKPVKVTAERIYISLANGKLEYNFKMEGRDLTSFMINNDSEPLMVIIEPTSGWARKNNEKYLELKNFIDPGSAVFDERQIVLMLSEKVEPPNLLDLMELVEERLSEISVWKTMTPESANAELKKLPPLDVNHSEAVSSSSVEKPALSTVLSAPVLPRKLYNTRSKDISSIRDPTRPPKKLLVYPPSCKQGAITITTEDVECLEPGIYLNDVIIDFFMKYLFEELLTVSDREKTHIFSSFFYKRLTQKNRLGSDKESRTPEFMHSLVKTWTKSVDIFSKDFLIFPINESSHWYLTVICYPGLVAERRLDDSSQDDKEQSGDMGSPLKELQELQVYDNQDSEDNKTEDNSKMSVDNDDEDFATPLSKKYKRIKTRRKKSAEKVPLKLNPCILIFDSLGGCHRTAMLVNLRNYLSSEWKERKGNDEPLIFDKHNLKGCFPKVPNQNNFSDCGVYVLQYAQSFFQNPIKDYNLPINIPHWFPLEVVEKKREFVKDLIYKLKDRIDIEV